MCTCKYLIGECNHDLLDDVALRSTDRRAVFNIFCWSPLHQQTGFIQINEEALVYSVWMWPYIRHHSSFDWNKAGLAKLWPPRDLKDSNKTWISLQGLLTTQVGLEYPPRTGDLFRHIFGLKLKAAKDLRTVNRSGLCCKFLQICFGMFIPPKKLSTF